MTTQEVANRFNELTKQGDWDKIQEELFGDTAVSIEPEHSKGLQKAEGIEAIKAKGKMFKEMTEEVHSGYCSDPIVGGNFFSVAMGLDITMKGAGRMKMDEIAVYEVVEGKIVKEQFFY
jgi:hypothetical protein